MADPSIIRALGLHHTLVTAVTDIIDNSIDAGAGHVLVRFLQIGSRISGLRIIDDGSGMDGDTLESAMEYGARREYKDSDQGMFGVGMKAASISQSDTVTVYSRATNAEPVGRRLSVTDRRDAPVREAFSSDAAEKVLAGAAPRFPMTTGTIVEWRGIRAFPAGDESGQHTEWLESTIGDLQDHLGLIFHRLIVNGLTISVDVHDELARRAGAPRTVRAVDPFGYKRSGDVAYPQQVALPLPGSPVVSLHIWPARVSLPEFKIRGLPGRESQGLFVYRNDRLLHPGGWLDVVKPRPEWGLARVAVDVGAELRSHVTVNPEKAGVTVDGTLVRALREVTTGQYLDASASALKAARKLTRRPITIVEPASGLPDEVLEEFADSFTFAAGADPVAIGWRVLPTDRVFEVDLDNRNLWLNARFRRALGGRRTTGVDVPFLRTLMYLLTQDMFTGTRHSARQQQQMDAWQQVLVEALAAESERQP